MGLFLPFRGYVPHKGSSYARENTAWNQKAFAQIDRFRDELGRINAAYMGACYDSGKSLSSDAPWFEDVYFEDDLENRPVLCDLSKMKERGSIVVFKLDDIYQKSLTAENGVHLVYISPIDRISARFMPVISLGEGSSSLVQRLKKLIDRGHEESRSQIQHAIIENYVSNLNSINSRIKQLERSETNDQKQIREKEIWRF
tara:strand:+ start:122 stop:721 length:600 start_codon:yes stop_codon:yes gene_type:complete